MFTVTKNYYAKRQMILEQAVERVKDLVNDYSVDEISFRTTVRCVLDNTSMRECISQISGELWQYKEFYRENASKINQGISTLEKKTSLSCGYRMPFNLRIFDHAHVYIHEQLIGLHNLYHYRASEEQKQYVIDYLKQICPLLKYDQVFPEDRAKGNTELSEKSVQSILRYLVSQDNNGMFSSDLAPRLVMFKIKKDLASTSTTTSNADVYFCHDLPGDTELEIADELWVTGRLSGTVISRSVEGRQNTAGLYVNEICQHGAVIMKDGGTLVVDDDNSGTISFFEKFGADRSVCVMGNNKGKIYYYMDRTDTNSSCASIHASECGMTEAGSHVYIGDELWSRHGKTLYDSTVVPNMESYTIRIGGGNFGDIYAEGEESEVHLFSRGIIIRGGNVGRIFCNNMYLKVLNDRFSAGYISPGSTMPREETSDCGMGSLRAVAKTARKTIGFLFNTQTGADRGAPNSSTTIPYIKAESCDISVPLAQLRMVTLSAEAECYAGGDSNAKNGAPSRPCM